MVVNNVKQATSTTAYANAVKGLSLEQAKLALSTKQLSAIEKEQILIKAGLLNATGKLTTGQLTEILTNKQRNAEDAKALLLSTGLISAETAEATATNVVETAKLEELVATKQLTVAEAELIAMKAKVTTANIKEASTTTVVSGKMAGSISILGSSVGSALTKIGSGLLSFASAHPIIAALTAVVGLVGITNSQLKKYEQEQKELIENAKTLQDEYRSFVQSSSDNINSLKAQADEFEELSKGVTKYGENISLSADEYDRYKSIVAEVLGYTPELVDGYNAEGTAIANKNSLIERSIELMKEEQRQKLKEMTTDEKTGVAYEGAKAEWNDVNAGYEGAYTRNEIARWFEDNSTSNGWNYEVDIAKILGIKDEWSNEGNNLQNAIINNIDTVAENIKNKKAELLALEDDKGVALFTETEIDNMIEKANDWEKAYTEWQQEIEDSKHGMDDQFALYAQRADGYGDLTDAQRAFVNEYIKATGDIVDADGRILSEDEMIEKAESYEKFVDKLATSPEFADARKKINELFALDSSTIPAGEYEKQINTILEELQTKFDLSDDEVKDFKIALGFDFIEDGSSTRVSELIEKVQGKLKDDFDDKALDLSLDDLIIASNLEVPKGVELSWEEFIKLLNEAKDIPNEITDLWDYSKTITELDTIKDKFDTLDKTYAKLFDSDSQISFEDYSSINEAFSDLEGIETYVQRLQEAGQNTEEVTAVMEDLISAYLDYTGILNNVTEENADLIAQTLTEMGIENAHEIVMAQLSVQTEILALEKQFLTEKGYELCEATLEEINQFLAESEASDTAKQSIAQLALETIDFANINLDESGNIQQLIALANAAGASAEKIANAKDALDYINDVESGTVTLNGSAGDFHRYDYASQTVSSINNHTYDWDYEELDANDFIVTNSSKYKPKYNSGSSTKNALSDASKSAESAKEEFEELFDFFEERVKRLDNAISLLQANLENVTGSYAKNTLLGQEINLNAEKINNYTDALAMYTQKANEALSSLPSDIAQKIQNGAVDLTTFVGDSSEDVVDAINEYSEWADKIADCKQELAELKEEIRQLELQKFNNVMEDFQNQFDIRDESNSLIDKQIELLETAGQLIGESFYDAQIEQSEKQLVLLQEEKAKLVEQLNSALASGNIEKGTDEWLEMQNALVEVDSQILECKTSIEEFNNELLQLNWNIFDRIQTEFSNIDSELGNLAELFDDFNDVKVSDGKGAWTNEALSTLGLYAQQYELARYQVEQYNDAINKLNEEYLSGNYSTIEYMDKLAELQSAQWECVESAESMENAIVSLNETRVNEEIDTINEEIDAYKELIDAQIEALRASKDLHDYEESIAEKTKSVTDLERQIAAMTNDNTASTVAKRKQLEEQLAEAKKDLEETQYDHSIEMQENALNKQYEDFEQEKNDEIEALEASLENQEALIYASFEAVKQNSDIIGQEIATIATQHGITVSNSLISAWSSGENAIASYGSTLSSQSSAFIANIMGVENEIWGLQAQANVTASSLASMFSTRADTLVNELTSSYYSTSNLNAMTNALQDSLVNTLERGYNISGVTSALSGIADAANSVASAANNAASALANMGAIQYGKSSTKSYIDFSNSSGGKIKTGNQYYRVSTSGSTSYIGNSGYVGKFGGTISKYASGTRSSKGELIITDENGYELKLPKLDSGNYTIANEGSQILTKAQTDNIFEWAKMNPIDIIPQSAKNLGSITNIPDVVSRNIQPNYTMQYGSLLTINGDVNDTNHFTKQIEQVVGKELDKSWKEFTNETKF